MHPIPVTMSLIGGVISAISVLGNATEMYLHGTQLWLNIVGCFWGILVVMFLILPTLYPLELISMMQLLMCFNDGSKTFELHSHISDSLVTTDT
ncbi:hypothetical protein Avbf_18860 [Armadillidium vulgare]|nr:hypothetical protein Avbf_18860 [Armadillidium vulgare]